MPRTMLAKPVPTKSDNEGLCIDGLGTIAVDHVFVAEPGGPFKYHSTRGGGSVWNVLAHLAVSGFSTRAYGAFASDQPATEAIHELASFSTDTTNLTRTEEGCTPIFTQWLDDTNRGGLPIPQENFTISCPVCDRVPALSECAQFSKAQYTPKLRNRRPSIVCVDRLTHQTAAASHSAFQEGAFTAIDLGGVSGLKSERPADLIMQLRKFDLISMPGAVALWLADGAVDSIAPLLLSGHTALFAVTRGREGFDLFVRSLDGAPIALHSQAPVVSQVIDACGAGDAFMAALIACALQSGSPDNPGHRLSFAASALRDLAAKLRAAPATLLSGIGARSSLPQPEPRTLWGKRLTELRGWSLDTLRSTFAHSRPCLFCGRD